MHEPNDSSYYRRRAAEAHALAFAATSQAVRKIHLDMAASYEQLAADRDAIPPRATLRLKL